MGSFQGLVVSQYGLSPPVDVKRRSAFAAWMFFSEYLP
jgi:hypothetical protein